MIAAGMILAGRVLVDHRGIKAEEERDAQATTGLRTAGEPLLAPSDGRRAPLAARFAGAAASGDREEREDL